MSDFVAEPADRRMRLRYDGRCRLCATDLPAGISAVYEPSRRTVRCIECVSASAPMPPIDVAPSNASDSDTEIIAAVPRAAASDDLLLRSPASAVIAETLRRQATAPPRSRSARLFGRSPLSADTLPWYLGAIGELEVGRVLDRLGAGWHVVHAIPVGRAGSDLDHLVVGPGGVFTVNSKYHEQKNVWVGGKTLLVNGQRTDHLRNAEFEARRTARALEAAMRRPVPVTPIVALVAARSLTVKERPKEVIVLRASEIPRWLRRRPTVLGPRDVDAIIGAVCSPSAWGNPTLEHADLAAFAALRESVRAARRLRRTWAACGALALVAPLGFAAMAAASLLQ